MAAVCGVQTQPVALAGRGPARRGPHPACSAYRPPLATREAPPRAQAPSSDARTSVAAHIGPPAVPPSHSPAPAAPQVSHIVPWSARPPPASQGQPRVLQVQSAAELQHLLACHPQRLLVAHFGVAGCASDEAFQPALHAACARHPAALFVRLAADPADAADAALLRSLGIGRLPCTLLLRGGQLLARVQVGAGEAAAALEAALAAHADGAAAALQAGAQRA